MNTALRMSIKQWAPEDRPTERLQRLGAESLTDAELLAILIGSGTQQYSAVDIGNQVMSRFNHNLNTLGKARFDEILNIEGVGTQTACKILAAVEFLPCKRPSAERGKRRQIASPMSMQPLLLTSPIRSFSIVSVVFTTGTSIICPSGIAYLAVLITTGYAPSSMLSSMTIENEMMVPSLPVISPPESESTVTETQSQPLLS